MNRQLDEVLVEALDLFEQGTPVVKILSRYPDLADELRPFLMTARDLNHLAKPGSTAAQEASKKEFLRYATTMQVEQRKSAADRLRDIFVYGLAFLLILFFSGAVMAVSSRSAIPGDALYGTKIFLEQTRLNYSTNSEAAAALIDELHQERLDEVKTLLSLGRSEIVTFSGELEVISQERWTVEGIPIAITSSTIIPDEVEAGFLVQIKGKTMDGFVVAEEVEVIADQLPDSDLSEPDPQKDLTPSLLPTIEPLNIPERPELLLPDNDSQINPTEPVPAPTVPLEDDSTSVENTEQEDDKNSQGSQEYEINEDLPENDSGNDGSVNDNNNESDEREADGQSDNDSRNNDEDSENSKSQEETDENDSDDETNKEQDSHEEDGENNS
jgi:hypothetical protein